jgi:hypothetical protein
LMWEESKTLSSNTAAARSLFSRSTSLLVMRPNA